MKLDEHDECVLRSLVDRYRHSETGRAGELPIVRIARQEHRQELALQIADLLAEAARKEGERQ